MKTRDEMTALLRAAAAPDTAAEALTTISAEITEMFDTMDANKAAMDQMTGQIAGLRDSNMRLFLRVTGDAGKPESDEDPAEKLVAGVEAKILEKFNGGN